MPIHMYNSHVGMSTGDTNRSGCVRFLISIDDTDNINTRGTGHLAEDMCNAIENNGWGRCSAISRHQLYVHEDIPYTSHNSAMCFEVTLNNGDIDGVIKLGRHMLEKESADGSDPGLCVMALDRAIHRRRIVEFGRDAKEKVLTKNDAYTLAAQLGLHLSEHGGTGQGVIGAMAGIGLRLSGNDGRFRGWYHLGRAGDVLAVDELTSYDFIDAVETLNGEEPDARTMIALGDDRIKTILSGNRQVVLVFKAYDGGGNTVYRTLTKDEIKTFDAARVLK